MTATILFCTAGWLLGWWALGRLRRVADLPTAPTGAYQLEVGLYNRHDLKRLPVLANGGAQVDDRILIALVIGNQ